MLEQQEAAFLKGTLRRAGLPSDFSVCVAQLAKKVRDHAHFEQLLTQAEPEFRPQFYEAVRPHLKFRAWPLDAYLASAGQRAERDQLPTMGEDGKLQHFHKTELILDAEAAIANALAKRALTLVCSKCTATETFPAVGEETAVAVILKARRAGWIYDYTADEPCEICPKCPTSLRRTIQ